MHHENIGWRLYFWMIDNVVFMFDIEKHEQTLASENGSIRTGRELNESHRPMCADLLSDSVLRGRSALLPLVSQFAISFQFQLTNRRKILALNAEILA